MRTCKSCKVEKKIEFFHENGTSKVSGEMRYRWRCKKCHNFKFQRATGKVNSGRFVKGRKNPEGFNLGKVPWNKGKKMSPQAIENNRNAALIRAKNSMSRSCLNNKQWRKACLERDNFTCQQCSSLDDMVVHHIKGFHKYPELRFDIENGITLCRSCHSILHGKELCNIKYADKKSNIGRTPWNKGKKLTEEHRKKLSESHKGQIPWNKK